MFPRRLPAASSLTGYGSTWEADVTVLKRLVVPELEFVAKLLRLALGGAICCSRKSPGLLEREFSEIE